MQRNTFQYIGIYDKLSQTGTKKDKTYTEVVSLKFSKLGIYFHLTRC